DFVERIKEETGTTTQGANIILDNMNAKYLERNISALAQDGQLVIIGLQGGIKSELNIGALLAKRGSVAATSLRARPKGQKAEICHQVVDLVWPLLSSGRIKPQIAAELSIQEVGEAHRMLEEDHPQ